MNDEDEIEPIDWEALGYGALWVVRAGLMITAIAAIVLGFVEIYDAHLEHASVEASMRISGAILVGAGLCSLAFMCYQFPLKFRRQDDSRPKL